MVKLSSNKKVDFSEITGIELKSPGMMTGGQVIFIINNIRYKSNGVYTFMFNVDKPNFSQLERVLKTLSNEIGVAIKGIKGYSVSEKEYSYEYEIAQDNHENVCVKNIEYRKRCNVCGHIFC